MIIRVLKARDAGCVMCNFAFSTDAYRFTLADARRPVHSERPPNRLNGIDVSASAAEGESLSAGLADARDWLRQNGPAQCTGCEPINAAFGKRRLDLAATPLGFR